MLPVVRNLPLYPDINEFPTTALNVYILKPLNNMNNHVDGVRPRHLSSGGVQSDADPRQKPFGYTTWEGWFKRWRDLKSSDAMEELRARDHIYRCMNFSCSYTTMEEKDFFEHLQASHAGKDLVCSYCLQDKFATAHVLIKHLRNHRNSGFQCPRCVYRASTPGHVLLHLKRYHRSREVEKVWRCSWATPDVTVEFSDSHIQPFCCADCRFQTKYVEEFGIHQATHPSTSCFYCMMFTTSFNDLLQHLKSHNIYNFHCFFCCFADDNAEKVFNHICLVHSEKPLTFASRMEVSIVNNRIGTVSFALSKNTENNTNLRALSGHDVASKEHTTQPHVEKCSAEKKSLSKDGTKGRELTTSATATAKQTCVCPFCLLSLSSRKNLFNHLTFTHHETEFHFCYDCNSCYESKKALEKHNYNCHGTDKMQAGTADKFVYLCVFCNFTSTVFTEMVDHMTAKLQVKDSSNVKADEEVGSWIRRYLKSQKSSDPEFLRPTRVNENVKGKTCPMCSLEFSSLPDCFNHVCDHLQYQPYKCSKCQETFKSQDDAANHGLSQHPQQHDLIQRFPVEFVENWIMKLVFGESKLPLFHSCITPKSTKKKHVEKDHPEESQHEHAPSVELIPTSLETNVHRPQKIVSAPNDTNSMPAFVAEQRNPEIETQDPSSTGEKQHNPEMKIRKSHSKSKEKLKSSSRNTEVAENMQVPETEVNLKCSECKFETADLNAFKNHCKSHHRSKHSKKCRRQDTVHEKATSREMSPHRHDNPIKSTKKARLYKCPLCNYLTSSVNKLSSHTKKRHASGAHQLMQSSNVDAPNSDGKTESNMDAGPSTAALSVARLKARRISSDASSDDSASEFDPESKKFKSNSESLHREEDKDTQMKEFSNYGKKPEPVNFNDFYMGHRNPGGDGWVKLSLDYYRDLFSKSIRVVLDDHKKHLLRSGFSVFDND